jgi:hypothetical protein
MCSTAFSAEVFRSGLATWPNSHLGAVDGVVEIVEHAVVRKRLQLPGDVLSKLLRRLRGGENGKCEKQCGFHNHLLP